jgi:DNA modification methylase
MSRATIPGSSLPEELAALPLEPRLVEIDLSLTDRNRVSALPWRGQFSPETVERLLVSLGPETGQVLDPFVGSGTTLYESANRGLSSLGFDVNPAAIALARCATLASLHPNERREELAAALRDRRQLLKVPDHSLDITLAHSIELLAHMEGSLDLATARVESIIESLPLTPAPTKAIVGDARRLPVSDASVELVLTSPPYINVFNYHQTGRPFTDELGWPVLKAARSEIGSNRQNRGNRFRTVIQYSVDMAQTLQELIRVVVPGRELIFVVGRESRVRGVAFSSSLIMAQIMLRMERFSAVTRAERVFTNRFGQRIWEDILVAQTDAHAPSVPSNTDYATAIGREVGCEALRSAGANNDPDRQGEIEGALLSADDIFGSPILAGERA